MTEKCLIIGASHAAAQLVFSLRQEGWTGEIAVLGEEAALPYHRPPLSKDFLAGNKSLDDLLIRPAEAYAAADIRFALGTRASRIEPEARLVHAENGDAYDYTHLVIATGAQVRHLPVPGAELPGVFYLRNYADVEKIQASMAPGRRAVIIGGGYIGLETAASLTAKGMSVTVIEAMPRILQRVTAPVMSAFYARVHREEGVTIVEGEAVSAIGEERGVLTVNTAEGSAFAAEMVIVGIGVDPCTALAQTAGIACDNGVLVNAHGETSVAGIYAAGDVTRHHNPIYDRQVRLESVPNATEQAKIVAAAICGKPKPYNSLPWFWSDQFDLKLQIAGLSEGYDDIVLRGDPKAGRSFAAFYFAGERLLAVDAVNRPQEFMLAKRLIPMGTILDKAKLSDDTVPVKDFMVR
ncbi:NAD(P)/FAD-dependent oxidoreductase [Parvularcula sp. IMCC14364]|uniref:NAD(P)/FAD-dependent oxidoreductase n=1 Tax=Parvularcula sp. IMCC14364 TaxID=3067902 RepID=UPI002740510A|nr:FAD-dependent oxidoreductase [Parvularcula sp. IMCC14364]